jgi:hypothetical protein
MKFVTASMLVLISVMLSNGCTTGERPATSSLSAPNVVTITARGLSFEAPDAIPSGWTTFRFSNESEMVHFAVLERLPEGIGIEQQQRQVAPVFQAGMDLLNEGKTDAAMKKFGELPEWFGKVVFMGGPGLTSGGRTSQASVQLAPGTYLMECYVKTAGVFHSYNSDPGAYGMVRQFTVTDEPSGAPEPEATLELTLSSGRGIEVRGRPVAGTNTVAVHFEDQTVHENFVGHDVHLVRLAEASDAAAVAAWMDWRQPHGLETPAPAEFLGGLHEMPAGTTGYITVRLEPGRYAWVAEVPKPDEVGMLRTFTVPSRES